MSGDGATAVGYRIRNISGVVTHHCVRFRDGVRSGWRQEQTLDDFLSELNRSPWVSRIRVLGEVVAA